MSLFWHKDYLVASSVMSRLFNLIFFSKSFLIVFNFSYLPFTLIFLIKEPVIQGF